MRVSVRIAQSGNSCRITLPPRPLQFLKWNAGTQLELIVVDGHRIELVETETFYREKYEREAAARVATPEQPLA